LYTNNTGGTKLKKNYIWGYVNKKKLNTTVIEWFMEGGRDRVLHGGWP
jgi:hypothetical protein